MGSSGRTERRQPGLFEHGGSTPGNPAPTPAQQQEQTPSSTHPYTRAKPSLQEAETQDIGGVKVFTSGED